jgi:hypothetical protein
MWIIRAPTAGLATARCAAGKQNHHRYDRATLNSPVISSKKAGSAESRRCLPSGGTMADMRQSGRRADLIVVGVEAALVAAAAAIGAVLNHQGVRLYADAAPLYATWRPHVGVGTPLALVVAGVVIWWGPAWAGRVSWPRLLGVGYLGAAAWTLSLALIDGWSVGLATRLMPQAEYLHEVPGVTDIPAMLAGFSGRILDFQPGSWSTHTAGHPPGALLVFVGLDRIGLGGAVPAALACVLVGATVAVSVPVALRALGDESAARAVLPFLVLFPGAVWVGVSGDGLFAGVVSAGLALLAVAGRSGIPTCAGRRPGPSPRIWAGALGGLLLGFALYLSYGFLLIGALALAVILSGQRGEHDGGGARHGIATLIIAAAGVGAVVVTFTAAGFWWLDGYDLVVRRYYQGWAAERPYGYWVWANLAALVLSAGPAAAPALRRAWAVLRPSALWPAGTRTAGGPAASRAAAGGPAGSSTDRRSPVVWLSLAAAVAVVAADLSGMSKAEVERIWLPFAVWLLVATARLPAADRRWWLAAQAGTALAVNHLLWTVS